MKLTKKLRDKILKSYSDLKETGSYSSASALRKSLGLTKIPLDVFDSVLDQNMSYVVHREVNKKYPRRKFISPGIFHTVQVDLKDIQKYKEYNSNYRFLLFCVDMFSKKLIIVPQFSKTGLETLKCLKKAIQKMPIKPKFIHADRGTEFYNSSVKSYLKSQNIKLYSTFNQAIK